MKINIRSLKTKSEYKKFLQLLHDGVVKFTFTKVNGDQRDADGTLNLEIINQELGKQYTPKQLEKGEKAVYQPSTITYYDIKSKGFRKFKIDNFEKAFEFIESENF